VVSLGGGEIPCKRRRADVDRGRVLKGQTAQQCPTQSGENQQKTGMGNARASMAGGGQRLTAPAKW
jgi:hypothetical protein